MLINQTMSKLDHLISKAINKSFSYNDYQLQMIDFAKNQQTSGPVQSVELINFTKLNQARMKRLNKKNVIGDEYRETIKNLNQKYTWLVFTESWCGDAAQTIPVINQLSELSDNIDFKVAYKEQNKELMSHFLTNGAEAIPKLLIINNSSEVLADWGPRPTTATKKVNDFKKENGKLTPKFKEQLQVWYNKNKGADTLNDLNVILLNIIIKNENIIMSK